MWYDTPLMHRPWLRLAAVALVVDVAAWLSFGALSPVAPSPSPAFVGLLPAWWWLPLGGAAILALFAWRPTLARAAWLLSALLILPWLPLPVPASFLVWTGPMTTWVWCATFAAVAVSAWPAGGLPALTSWFLAPRRAVRAAFVAALACYLAASVVAAPAFRQGDEPHYLVITQSLLYDHDLKIENNHERGDYLSYFPGGVLRPDFLKRGVDGEIYSIHAPGLSALVLPAFALAGYPGVVVFLALLGALGTAVAWKTAFRLTGNPLAAWFGWGVTALGVPFFFHAITVYPDGVGAVIVMVAVWSLTRFEPGADESDASAASRLGVGAWLGVGALLAILPWLHTRFAGLAAVLGILLGLRLLGRREFGSLVALGAIPLVSAAGWFAFFHAIYGVFNPAAPYGSRVDTSLASIPGGLAGLFLDQQFGILTNAPAYALALAGLWELGRRRLRLSIELVVLVASYLATVASYHMWWAGSSSPARFAVAVMLVMSLPAASWWAARGVVGRAVGTVALGLTLLITGSLVMAQHGGLILNERGGTSRWMDWVSPLVNLPQAVPSFFANGPLGATWRALIWAAILLVAVAALVMVTRRAGGEPVDTRRRLALAGPALFGLALMAATTVCWAVDRVEPLTPTSAQLEFVSSYDVALRPTGLQYHPIRIGHAPRVISQLQIGNSNREANGPDAPLLFLVDVPAGIYRVRARDGARLQGTFEVTIGRTPEPMTRWTLDESSDTPECRVNLPVPVNAVIVNGDARARASAANGLVLEPVSVIPSREAAGTWHASRARRYAEAVVFIDDPMVSYLEGPGMWVVGAVDAKLAVTTDQVASMPLLVRNGASANSVRLQAGQWSQTVTLKAGEERVVQVPVSPVRWMTRLDVRAESGFRPAEVDKASRDQRFLGVWLQPLPTQNRTTAPK